MHGVTDHLTNATDGRLAGAAFDGKTRQFSMARTLSILNDLRGGGEKLRKAS